MESIGLYIHIPFCRRKCLYCDFPSYTGLEDMQDPYTAALCREISDRGGFFADATVDTIYVGGGTPTLLSDHNICRIMESVYRSFTVAADAEISMEANPGTVDKCKLAALKACGVNRMSFGVQSFSDRLLKIIGRIHSAREAEMAVEAARKAGIDNINVDLMYGLPEQSPEEFRRSIKAAAALGVQHVSAYGLTIEENTPFARMEKAGSLNLPDDCTEEAMYDSAVHLLPDLGFGRYEISNYSHPGRVCRHNLKYWHDQPYIGLGAAAHSYTGGERRANTGDVGLYMKAAAGGRSPVVFREKPDAATAMAEYIFLALRTVKGVNYDDFFRRFHENFNERNGAVAAELTGKGLLAAGRDGIRLTELGMKYGNRVFASFLPDKA